MILVYLVVSYCVIIAGLLCLFVADCWWCVGGCLRVVFVVVVLLLWVGFPVCFVLWLVVNSVG